MSWYKKLFNEIAVMQFNKRFFGSIGILIALFVLLNNKIMDWYDAKIVTGLLSSDNNENVIKWIVIFVMSVVTLLLTINYWNKRVPISKEAFTFILLLISIYGYYRYISYRYSFFPTESHLKYLDYFILLFLCVIALGIRSFCNKYSEPKYYSNPFLTDEPIDIKGSGDSYNREGIAEFLAEKIQSKADSKSSLAIGIVGKWGIGKTSFLNLVKSKTAPQNRIIIEFNPWQSTSPHNIIEDFFQLLISEFRKYDTKLSSDLKEYANSLANVDENYFSKILKYLIFTERQKQSTNTYYANINDTIKKLKKQVVIFIDDLDRLDKKEIIEVLRLIRNTANFSNTVYVVAYAKEYVEEAIKDFNPHEHEYFLEKIFQFEFHIPEINSDLLKKKLIEVLQEKLALSNESIISNAINIKGADDRTLTDFFIKNPRDITRLCNSFLFGIKGIMNEVDIMDFYLLELLKLKYYNIYGLIAANLDLIFYRAKGKLRLRRENELSDSLTEIMSNMMPSNNNASAKEKSRQILDIYLNEADLKKTEKSVISGLIELLLTEKDNRLGSNNKNYNSFVYNYRFEKYFTIQQIDGDIPTIEFENIRRGNYLDYETNVKEWISKGSLFELENKLNKIFDYDSRTEWMNHLRISILIAREKCSRGANLYTLGLGQIVKTLCYPKMGRRGQLLFENEENDYKKDLHQLFNEALEPYIIESNLLVLLSTSYWINSSPINDIAAKTILYNYFEKYCNEHTSITNEFRTLHSSIMTYPNSPQFLKAINAMFVDYFRLHLEACGLNAFIRVDPSINKFTLNTEWISTFFNSIPEFMDYTKTAQNIDRNSDCFKEFENFIKSWEKANGNSVEFVFRSLSVNNIVL